MRVTAAVVVLAMGCGSDPQPDDGARDGSRLKVIWASVEDTSVPTVDKFHDAELDVDCSPTPWNDGVERCLGEAGDVAYLDAACSQPAGYDEQRGDAPPTKWRYFTRPEVADGALRVAAAYVRAPSAGTGRLGQLYHRGADGACVGPSAATRVYDVTELAPSTLVTIHREQTDTPIAAVAVSSDDGMRVELGLHDARGFDCDPLLQSDGTLAACAPRNAYFIDKFSDASCTIGAIQRVQLVPSSPLSIFAVDDSPATHCPHFHATSFDAGGGQLYELVGGCQPVADYGLVYDVGSSITLAPLSLSVDLNPGHRYEHVRVTAGTASAMSDLLYDTVMGVDCRISGTTCAPIAPIPSSCTP